MKVSKELRAKCEAMAGIAPEKKRRSNLGGTTPEYIKLMVRRMAQPKLAIEVTVPIKLGTGKNMRENPHVRAKRVKLERHAVAENIHWLWGVRGVWEGRQERLRVTLTKIGGNPMDDDNVSGSLAHVRDEVAEWIRRNDGCGSVDWLCEHRPGKLPRGVLIRVETL